MSDENIEGLWVKLTTTSNVIYEGYIYTYDKTTDLVILQSPSTKSSNEHDFHIVKLPFIKQIVPSKEIPKNLNALLPITKIPIEKLILQEKKAIFEEKERIARLGVGVSDEAQNIFDGLSKTLPVHWQGKNIIVLNDVCITPPYTASACALFPTGNDNQVLLERIQKVLQGERRRLELETN